MKHYSSMFSTRKVPWDSTVWGGVGGGGGWWWWLVVAGGSLKKGTSKTGFAVKQQAELWTLLYATYALRMLQA